MNHKIRQSIVSAVNELNEDWGYDAFNAISDTTILFGAGSPIDSMGLVTLVATIEQNLKDAFGVDLVLADEYAFSRNKSPFRSVGALESHVEALLGALPK
jgi:acyl carrier protein